MKLSGRDWAFVAIVVAVLLLLLTSTGREKAKDIPHDQKHRAILTRLASGGKRQDVEKVCVTCHNSGTIPLPRQHPPKEQCLLCHRSGQ